MVCVNNEFHLRPELILCVPSPQQIMINVSAGLRLEGDTKTIGTRLKELSMKIGF